MLRARSETRAVPVFGHSRPPLRACLRSPLKLSQLAGVGEFGYQRRINAPRDPPLPPPFLSGGVTVFGCPSGRFRILGGGAAAQEDLRPPLPLPATIWHVVSIFAQIHFDELRWAVGKYEIRGCKTRSW